MADLKAEIRMGIRIENFCYEYAKDLNASKAARRCGWHPGAGVQLLGRLDVRYLIGQILADRSKRLKIDADFVLSELIQQYWRLMGMLGHDIAEICNADGTMKPLQEWPEIWRTDLITGIDVEEMFGRSNDNTDLGHGGWDVTGTVKKIKRESKLAIEKQITQVIGEIGRHTNVKAFPVPGETLGEGLTDYANAINAAIAEGRQRAARALKA
jgi:phage terminase small subunit